MVKLWVAKLDVDADESIENQIKPNNTKITVMVNTTGRKNKCGQLM